MSSSIRETIEIDVPINTRVKVLPPRDEFTGVPSRPRSSGCVAEESGGGQMNTNDKRIEVLQRANYRDADRYRKLRAWLEKTENYTWLIATGNYKLGEKAFSKPRGEQFDAAVDALPEPQEK